MVEGEVAERGSEVVGPDEQHIDTGDSSDGLAILDAGAGLDLDNDEGVLVGVRQVVATVLVEEGGGEHGAGAADACGVGGGGVFHSGDDFGGLVLLGGVLACCCYLRGRERGRGKGKVKLRQFHTSGS